MSSSSGKSDEQHVDHPKLAELKRLREMFYLRVKSHRYLFLDELLISINNWTKQLPNLRDIFTKQEMDWLLEASIDSFDQRREIVDFFIRCGYKDEPNLDEDGKPMLRRTTQVHQIDQYNIKVANTKIAALKNLFKIYDKFDVNYIDESGYSHFHVACKYGLTDVARKFLELCQIDLNCFVAKTGDLTLHVALKHNRTYVIGLLLRSGADPNLANRLGSTALHVICWQDTGHSYSMMKMLLEICNEKHLPVKIDARDNEGNTPLHLALSHGSGGQLLANLLLGRGADPNSVNDKGETPLHIIAKQGRGGERFFRAIGDTQKVRIDTRDNSGRTALEWAVASCCPLAVVSLLERGADASCFVFPTPSDSDSYRDINRSRLLADISDFNSYDLFFNSLHALDRGCSVTKLAATTGLLAIVELLEPRVGHELDLGDALKVMGFFDKYKLFYESADFSTTEDVDDLVDSIFEEMPKKSTYTDYFKFASSYTLNLDYKSKDACDLRLCEKVTRKFFHDWAVDCFMELIHYRLPFECCEKILENLTNKDLYNICLAAKGQTDEQDKINVIKTA